MEEEIEQALNHYSLGTPRSSRRVESGFVNETWIVGTDRGRYFVKRRHPDLRNVPRVQAQHALVEHLRRRGFPAPTLVPSTGGKTLLALEGELYEVQEHVEGAPYDHDRPAHLHAAAYTLGRYHGCVQGFAPPALHEPDARYSPALLRANLDRLAGAWALEGNPALARAVRQLEAHAADLAGRFAAHGELPHLVIHGDYYAGNLLFEGDCVVAVVDYDKAGWQPRVVELAEALIYFASPRPGHLEHLVYPGFIQWEPFTHFLRHYARASTVDETELCALPDHVRCIWLQMSLLRLGEKATRPPKAAGALGEAVALGDWGQENREQMIEIAMEAADVKRET